VSSPHNTTPTPPPPLPPHPTLNPRTHSDEACRDKAIAATKSLDCDGHTFYPGLGLMGMVCFAPPTAGSSREADAGTLAYLRSALLTPPGPSASATINAATPLPLFTGLDMDRPVRLILPSMPTAHASVEGEEVVSINSTLHRGPGSPGKGRNPPSSPPASQEEEATIEATPYNWGRDRINQVSASLDQRVGTCASKGRGVRVYILDTGCRTSHAEFRTCSGCSSTRATTQSVTLSDGSRPYGSGGDGNGHGTHTAGIAAGLNVGTAPLAAIRCIKVLGNDGSAPM
jgi:subtilisin family serine protease